MIIKGNVATEAAKLRSQDGKDLVTYGHGLLGQTLLEHRLLDQLKLWIHPLLVGCGQLFFRQNHSAKFELVSTKILGTGVVVATYQPILT